jgi:hypothetical protein
VWGVVDTTGSRVTFFTRTSIFPNLLAHRHYIIDRVNTYFGTQRQKMLYFEAYFPILYCTVLMSLHSILWILWILKITIGYKYKYKQILYFFLQYLDYIYSRYSTLAFCHCSYSTDTTLVLLLDKTCSMNIYIYICHSLLYDTVLYSTVT